MHSISTAMLPGSEPIPTALRAASPLSKDFDHQFAEAVDDLRVPLKVGRRVDHPQDFQDPADPIEAP